ncbi:MAG: GGDEF domain-containing protein, partial [Fusobacteriaceae bacterium]
NIALNKENIILRDILDKGLAELIFVDDFRNLSTLEKRKEEILEQKKHKRFTGLIFSITVFLGLFLIYQTFKIVKHKNRHVELLKDELTRLSSRRVYNEFCKQNNSTKGCALLLDLNNFKAANDTYGHHHGDLILIEVAQCLRLVFAEDYLFRISGDEFYIFSNFTHSIDFKLEKLKKAFENSELLKSGNISFSLGYYYKDKDVTMIKAFKYADAAMYKAKKSKKWYLEAEKIKLNKKGSDYV